MRLGEEYLLLGAMVVLENVHPRSFPYLRGTSARQAGAIVVRLLLLSIKGT